MKVCRTQTQRLWPANCIERYYLILIFKRSAIAKGYINDPFAHFFVKTHAKKDVIIHRGYWCRVSIFRSIINKFLLSAPTVPKQIISLGSGYDTL